MRYARVFLAFALAVSWLGLAAPPRAAYDSAAAGCRAGAGARQSDPT